MPRSRGANEVPDLDGQPSEADQTPEVSGLENDEEKTKKISLNHAADVDGPVGVILDPSILSNDVRSESIPPPNDEKDGQNIEGLDDKDLGIESNKEKDAPKEDDGKDIGNAEGIELNKEEGVPGEDDDLDDDNSDGETGDGSDDDGLDDDESDDGVGRKKKMSNRRKSVIYDNIWMSKGKFLFPYKTYRPKVQVCIMSKSLLYFILLVLF